MFQFVLTDICRSFLRVSKVTEKIKTRLKPTLSENFNSHPLYFLKLCTYDLDVYFKFPQIKIYFGRC
jgi:hypothetical protein